MNTEARLLAMAVLPLIEDIKLRKLVYNTMDAIYSVGRHEGFVMGKEDSSKE